MSWPKPSGEEVTVGSETAGSEIAGAPEDGALVASWESEGWADDSAVEAGGTEWAG